MIIDDIIQLLNHVVSQRLQKFLPEGQISYYKTVQGSDILGNVMSLFWDMLHSSKSKFPQICYFFIVDKMTFQAGFVPRAAVWRLLV